MRCIGRGLDAPSLLHALIHRSAWKGYSANFAFTEFSEPRFESFKQAGTKPEVAARIPAQVGSKRGVLTVLHTVVYGVLVVGGVCILALVGFELVHRLVPAPSRQRHNDVAGFIYAALGVIYAVLLALVVITVWEEYQAASETVEQEANATAEIFLLGYELPEPEGTHIQELARSYAEEVVHKEWPLMEQGNQPPLEQEAGTQTGWNLIDDIRASVHS